MKTRKTGRAYFHPFPSRARDLVGARAGGYRRDDSAARWVGKQTSRRGAAERHAQDRRGDELSSIPGPFPGAAAGAAGRSGSASCPCAHARTSSHCRLPPLAHGRRSCGSSPRRRGRRSSRRPDPGGDALRRVIERVARLDQAALDERAEGNARLGAFAGRDLERFRRQGLGRARCAFCAALA